MLRPTIHIVRQGFTLIELMVTIAVLSIMLMLAAPSFGKWAQNTKTRTVAETLQNGIRLAQTEASRRSRQVTFSLVNQVPTPAAPGTPVANGKYWVVQTVPLLTGGETSVFIQGSAIAGSNTNVTVTASTPSLTFNTVGRLLAGSGAATYDISTSGGDRPLRVTVAASGKIRLCDPAFTVSDATPTGC